MSSLTLIRPARPRLEARAWLRTVGRAGPEQWVWCASIVGWLVLTGPLWAAALGPGSSAAHRHEGFGSASTTSPWSSAPAHLVMWTGMVLATMLPLIAPNLRRVGLRSPRGRRTRATVEVAAGWLALWLSVGVVVAVVTPVAIQALGPDLVVVLTAAIAVGWQATAARRRARARCHRSLAPPLGEAASASCLRFGSALGRDCVTTCWATMALMAVAGHQLVVVLPLAWLAWRDRRLPADRPGTFLPIAVLIGVAGVAVLA